MTAGRAQDRVSSPAKDRRFANCATQPSVLSLMWCYSQCYSYLWLRWLVWIYGVEQNCYFLIVILFILICWSALKTKHYIDYYCCISVINKLAMFVSLLISNASRLLSLTTVVFSCLIMSVIVSINSDHSCVLTGSTRHCLLSAAKNVYCTRRLGSRKNSLTVSANII